MTNMREAKFRGKRVDNGEWVYGVPIVSINNRTYMIHGATEDAVNTKNEVDFYFCDVIPETVGQLTWIKDKNGKEIYADDICKDYDGKAYRIIAHPGYFSFAGGVMGCGELEQSQIEIEIIGNIHEQDKIK